MANKEVVVLSAVRSAVGTFGGALKDIEPAELGGMAKYGVPGYRLPRTHLDGEINRPKGDYPWAGGSRP